MPPTSSLAPVEIPAPRRSQDERSAATRAALAEATIGLLVERGWAAVSAVEICRRVGLSRGAFHHHYDTIAALLADALEALYTEMGHPRRSPATDMRQLLDRNWKVISAPRFKAVIEAWLAMANDPDLRSEIGPVVARFATLLRPDTITHGVVSTEAERDFSLTAREAMLGLALGRAVNGGVPLGHERKVLTRLRAEAATFTRSDTGARS